METLWAVLVSVGLVVGGLLLLAVLVRMTGVGRRERRRPRRGRRFVAVDGACKPSRGQIFVGCGEESAKPSKRAPGSSPPGGTPLPTRVDFTDMTPIIIGAQHAPGRLPVIRHVWSGDVNSF